MDRIFTFLSSQIIRKRLFSKTIKILEKDYEPQRTWIQLMNQNEKTNFRQQIQALQNSLSQQKKSEFCKGSWHIVAVTERKKGGNFLSLLHMVVIILNRFT